MRALVVCPTYGRLPYLGRLLSSFLHQTYDDKHLVIINDDRNITLRCEYDSVTVLNCSRRLSVGEKRNLGASYGHFDIIHPWDDDDIFFPKRLENHMAQYVDDTINAYRNFSSYTLYDSIFTTSHGGTNSKSYRKNEFMRVGGYSSVDNFAEDLELHKKLSSFKKITNENERDFMYGFSSSNYHLVCKPTFDQLEQIAYKQLLDLNLVGGVFDIIPDDEQYMLYLKLDELFKRMQTPLKVKHLDDGRIDISHLL